MTADLSLLDYMDGLKGDGTVFVYRTCNASIPKPNTIGDHDIECGTHRKVWVHIVGDRTIWACDYCATDHEGLLDDLVEDLVR